MPSEQDYIERTRPEDAIESTHYELQRAHEYSSIEEDGEYKYSTVKLESMGRHWMHEAVNPLRSPRSQAEAEKIVELIIFEVAYRNGEVSKLEALYSA